MTKSSLRDDTTPVDTTDEAKRLSALQRAASRRELAPSYDARIEALDKVRQIGR